MVTVAVLKGGTACAGGGGEFATAVVIPDEGRGVGEGAAGGREPVVLTVGVDAVGTKFSGDPKWPHGGGTSTISSKYFILCRLKERFGLNR